MEPRVIAYIVIFDLIALVTIGYLVLNAIEECERRKKREVHKR
nr:MAG TPA: hypothetical protein [Caudoviricetes sp.]